MLYASQNYQISSLICRIKYAIPLTLYQSLVS